MMDGNGYLFFWAPKSLQMVIAVMKLKDAYSLEEDTSLPSRANPSILSLMCLMGIISFLFCARNIHSTSDSELKDLGFALRS